ncbi:MAG: DUF4349 domain-containing protein [Candidatus Limnocylindrales bacterium]
MLQPRNHLRPAGGLVAITMIALLLGACSGSAAPLQERTGDSGAVSNLGAPVAAPAEPAGGQGGGTGGSQSGTTDTAVSDQAAAADQALIVKTGSLDLQVTDVDATVVRARTLVSGFGGYVSGSQQTTSSDQPIASITYRIPADRWDDALNALRGLGTKVLGEKTGATEVTGQVLDLGARIQNLRVTEAAFQGIMAKATKISDILAVQAQLTDVQGQIEELSTEQTHLQQQAADGTLTVSFEAPVVAVTSATNDWSFGEQVDRALAQLVQVGQAAATALVWLGIVGLPFLLVGLVLGGLLVALRRRVRRSTGGPLTPPADASAA